jgi:methanogenic corrinoid protein MtbC1
MRDSEDKHGMNIGALSKATGVPVETLRTWERRYGFPNPTRDDYGHRVYNVDVMEHVRLVDAAIKAGHRASSAVALDLETLKERFGDSAGQESASVAIAIADHQAIQIWLDATMNYDGETLEGLFRRDWTTLGGLEFLKKRVHPFLVELGLAWTERRLEIGHEHFASERLRDFLTTLWRPLSDRSAGPRVVCATLPGETHSLGLQMAAMTLSIVGCRVMYLGTDTPLQDLVDAAMAHQSAAVCVSVSVAANRFTTVNDLSKLREALPSNIALITGGAGARPGIPGVDVFRDLDGLLAWGHSMVAPQHEAAP